MSDLVKASETVGRLCDRIEQLERELERWKDIADATESLKQSYAEMLTAEKALADQLYEELIRSGMVMSQSILNYRKARGL